MTKQDYVILARLIKTNTIFIDHSTEHSAPMISYYSFINNLCHKLETDNPKFDKEIFLKAINYIEN